MKLTFCLPPRTDEFSYESPRLITEPGDGITIQPMMTESGSIWLEACLEHENRLSELACHNGRFHAIWELQDAVTLGQANYKVS